MSEKESEFIKSLKQVGGGLMLAMFIGLFSFYAITIKTQSAQEQINKNTEMRLNANEDKTETMRLEWRQDQEKTNMNIDKIATRLNERAGYINKERQ